MTILKQELPINAFLSESKSLTEEKFDLKVMTDCRGVKKLVKDLYGQYCFNFIGTLGGYKLKTLRLA